MRVRLAGGVVAADLEAWLPGPGGPVRLAAGSGAPAGAAVALGPVGAGGAGRAVAELTRLVRAGGVVVAGAGIDLGGGYRSARLAGARGDQRDAVLAALRVLGADGAGRMGDRAGFLVALFGPAVTKRVGAAAAEALAEGRWAALHLASAASDVLGPEQLERVLALTGPEEAVPGGLPSVLAGWLGQVLEPVPRPRRLELVADLWDRVAEHHAGLARRARLLATQGHRDRVDDLRRRRGHHEDTMLLGLLRSHLGEPSLIEAARWSPPDFYWYGVLDRLIYDTFAATALLRTAVAVGDHGLEDGLARSVAVIEGAWAHTSDDEAVEATRKVAGLTGLPARPMGHIRELRRILDKDRTYHPDYVKTQLRHARDHALLLIDLVGAAFGGETPIPEKIVLNYGGMELKSWRKRAGYGPARPPGEWAGLPGLSDRVMGDLAPLDERLRARPDADPADVERVGDLLWLADLADALAVLHGHPAALAKLDPWPPWFDHDPPAEPEPLTPRLDSIPLAVSGAAQLVALGGTPSRARTWRSFTGDLRAGIAIDETLDGEFPVPPALAAVDGTLVPGTTARFQVARNGRTLAGWSDYMGNCIAGPYYRDAALAGRCALAALVGPNSRILANVDLRPLRPAVRGWHVAEIEGRFNDSPDGVLEERFRAWIGAIPGAPPAEEIAAPPPDEAVPGRRRAGSRLLDAGPALGRLAEPAWDAQVTATVLDAFAALAGSGPGTALTRLRRMAPAQLDAACRRELGQGDLVGLWTATGVRPLRTAIGGLDPELRARFEPLLADPPLPGALRRVARLPGVAPSYSLDLMARRVRASIGRLAAADDPVIARAVTGRTTVPLLCALVLAITCRAPEIRLTAVAGPRAVTVPGFPSTTLNDADGPWQRALPAAGELGADTTVLWDRIAAHGLRAPASWLEARPWPTLWASAH